MSRNPLLNALAASCYIILVALLFSFARFLPEPTNPLEPAIAVLTLFVFSAAMMGYLILGMPLRMFLEGEKQRAVAFFGKTLAAFAALGAIFFLLSFLIPAGWFLA